MKYVSQVSLKETFLQSLINMGERQLTFALQIPVYRAVSQFSRAPCLSNGRGAATAAERAVGAKITNKLS